MHRACHDNNEVALRLLMEKGVNLDCADVEGRTPLHWAATIKEQSNCLQVLF